MPFYHSVPRAARFRRLCRPLAFAAGFALTLIGTGLPALAQGINILRDTETEEMLKSYEPPLAKAAGLNPDATQGLAGGRSMR